MARPLRIEFAGALYHVTSRGNARAEIFLNDADRRTFLDILCRAVERYNWSCHGYCLMDNHYHLLIETADKTLSKGMKYLNGTYTQYFNRRHNRVGHIYQGRFKAILVEKDAYLMTLIRYVVLNPVRAKMVRSAKDWPWSSYRGTAGLAEAHACLNTDWVLSMHAKVRPKAQQGYREFIADGKKETSPWQSLKNQIYLGSDEFVIDMQHELDPEQSLNDIPRKQKNKAKQPLSYFIEHYEKKKEAMAMAYLSGHYTLEEVGRAFDRSYVTVSRAVKAFEESSGSRIVGVRPLDLH